MYAVRKKWPLHTRGANEDLPAVFQTSFCDVAGLHFSRICHLCGTRAKWINVHAGLTKICLWPSVNFCVQKNKDSLHSWTFLMGHAKDRGPSWDISFQQIYLFISQELIRAGMNVARLNFSHGDHPTHARSVANVRQVHAPLNTKTGRGKAMHFLKACLNTGLACAIMLDNKGSTRLNFRSIF